MDKVKVGQIWQDDDPRSSHAKLEILKIDGGSAICQRGARKTRIRLDRFHPGATGYRLVQDVPDVPDDDEKKLTFGELAVGDHFIGFPTPGDNSGHGGYLTGHRLWRKTEQVASGEAVPVNSGSAVDHRGIVSYFPFTMPVLKIVDCGAPGTVWVALESAFNCSERPGHIIGVFSTEGEARTLGKEPESSVFPLRVGHVVEKKKFVPDH